MRSRLINCLATTREAEARVCAPGSSEGCARAGEAQMKVAAAAAASASHRVERRQRVVIFASPSLEIAMAGRPSLAAQFIWKTTPPFALR